MRFDTSMVIAGRPLTRVTEVASLKVGLTCATSQSVTDAFDDAMTGIFRMSCGFSNSDGTLTAKRPVSPSSAPAAISVLKDCVTETELVERDAVALHQRRIDDDLDRLVARAAQFGREHAGRLLDRVLGGARDAQQRALGHVAGQRDHQHRIEREVDLVHLRLVGVARQIVLGLVDLGAHVGERGLGIEAGLELEQHVAAALEGGRAHLLDVADRLELGLDRPQQQPLGILRADAALGELDVDDRDLDVRLGLLRDRHIGHEARAQQEEQRRDGQPRVADGVVDEAGHHSLSCVPCPKLPALIPTGREASPGLMLATRACKR